MDKFYKSEKIKDTEALDALAVILWKNGVDAVAFELVERFIGTAAENDRRYRISMGATVPKKGPYSYSRKGKTITFKRRAIYYANEIRRAIASARRIHPETWTVALRVNGEGDLIDPELNAIDWIASRGRGWAEIEIKPAAVTFRNANGAVTW